MLRKKIMSIFIGGHNRGPVKNESHFHFSFKESMKMTAANTSLAPCLMASIILAIAPLHRFPMGYYLFLRYFVFFAFGYYIFRGIRSKANFFCWTLVIPFILFNPIKTVWLPRFWWAITDYTAIVILWTAFVILYRGERKTARQIGFDTDDSKK
jgi:hypothetical protein